MVIKYKKTYEVLTFERGELIFKENQPGDCAYLIKSGVVVVYKEIDGEKVILGKLKSGDLLGEMAVITGEPRTASAVAAEESELLTINEDSMQAALSESLPIIKALVNQLIERFNGMNKQHTELADQYKRIKRLEIAINDINSVTAKFSENSPRTPDMQKLIENINQICERELKIRYS